MGTVALACILLLMLTVLFVGYKRRKTDEKDVSHFEETTLTPLPTAELLACTHANGYANDLYPMAGVLVPAIHQGSGSRPGDRLWRDFRRCTAFDRLYFGNPLMQASNVALEDNYVRVHSMCFTENSFHHKLKPLLVLDISVHNRSVFLFTYEEFIEWIPVKYT